MGLVLLLVVVIVLVGGGYLLLHPGGTTTVHNPTVTTPHVDVMSYVDQGAAWLGTPTGGTFAAVTFIGILMVSLYKKLPKGIAITLAVLVTLGVLAFGGAFK